jgi:sigma-B regulation protein RsbU (phosphoserine phosphatase)
MIRASVDRGGAGRSRAGRERPREPRGRLSLLLVAGLLVLGTLADYWSGPVVAAAAFYVVPVGLTAWLWGNRAGVPIALAAATLNVATEWSHPDLPLPGEIMLVNQGVLATVFLVIAWLAALAGEKQRLLARQRGALARINTQMETEMRAARALQELLTPPPPRHPSIEIETFFRPARIVGGDAVDFALTPGGRLAIAVADVAGKGSPAALAGAVLIGMLADAPAREDSPADTLRYLNDRLVERLPDELFVTLFYALVDLATGELVYASAGHEPAILFPAAGGLEELMPTGTALGIQPEAEYRERSLRLAAGDSLFVYTDGILDLRQPSGERLGFDGLWPLVAKHLGVPCADLISGVAQDAGANSASRPDDITLVVVRYAGSEAAHHEMPAAERLARAAPATPPTRG